MLYCFGATIYYLIKKKWIEGIIYGVVSGGSVVAVIIFFVAFTFLNFILPDRWADNLTIPEGIELNIPLGNEYSSLPDSILQIPHVHLAFQLYNDFQPGMYKWDFWHTRIDSGVVFLKAFEITQEYPLSVSGIAKSSEVKVYNPTDTTAKFSSEYNFTVYEGDWGQYYAARFEVWFKPSSGSPSKKLTEKIFKIEGWMH